MAPAPATRLASQTTVPPLISFANSEYLYDTNSQDPANPRWVATGDFNGDGKQDIAVVDTWPNDGTNHLRIELGNGSGGFTEAASYSLPNGMGRIAVADLNRDGKPDIVVGQGSAGVAVFLNTGAGTFSGPSLYSIPTPPGGTSAPSVDGLAIADLTGSGVPDIVTGDGAINFSGYDHTEGTYSVIMGNGDGTFQAAQSYGPVIPNNPANGGGYPMNGIALGNLNGKVGMVVAAGGNTWDGPAGFEWLLGNGDGTFTYNGNDFASVGNYYQGAENVTLADFNGDGHLDVAVSDQGCGFGDGNDTQIFLGDGAGGFTAGQNLQENCVLGDQVATDLNGDGILDLVVISGRQSQGYLYGDTYFHVFVGNGDGTFTDAGRSAIAPGYGTYGVAAGDFNGDGRPDLVAANGGDSVNGESHDLTIALNTSPKAPIGGAIKNTEVPGGFCAACAAATQGETSKPVDTGTGDFWHTFSDLSVPGRGIPLNFSHTYNEVDAGTSGPLGYGWTFPYNTSLSINQTTGAVTINEETGAQEVFTPSGGTYTAPPRVMAALVKNADGTYTLTVRSRTSYTFSSIGTLVSEKDLNGYITSLAYNGSGQLATVTDQAGRSLTLSYSGGHLASVSDPLGRQVTFQYNDGNSNLTDVYDVNGGLTHFSYDSSHRLLTMTDPRGSLLTNSYDAQGRVYQQVSSQTSTVNLTTTFAYSGNPQVDGTTTITDPSGNVEVDTYYYGERVAVTKGYGTSSAATWVYGYDPATVGVTTVTDPNGNTTQISYDAAGDVLTQTDALQRQTVNTYDSLNDLKTSKDANGVTTTYTYDGSGNLQSTSRPLVGSSPAQTQVTTYNYGDPSHPGDVTSKVDPDGKTWSYGYDQYGDLISATDPLRNTATATYNVVGWKLTSISPRGNVTGCGCASQYTTTYGYVDTISGRTNEDGLVATVTDPLGHVTADHFDADRNLTSSTDPNGKTTSATYDLANEKTVVTRADSTTLQTDYNPNGTVLDEKDGKGNVVIAYQYDPLARVVSTQDGLEAGSTCTVGSGNQPCTQFSYDPAGNLVSKTDPGGNCSGSPTTGCTTMLYDAANQLKSISYSDGVTPNVTNIGYDGDGQRTAMTDGTGTSSWVWDSLHRLTSYTDGRGDQVQYAYNLRNLPTTITYPGSLAVTRGYNDAGQWTSVQDWLGNTTAFGYDPDGNLTSKTLPSSTGEVDTSIINAAEQLTSISDVKGASTLFSATYARDSAGQVASDTSVPSTVGAFKYTPLNQLCYAGSSSSSACTSPPSGAQAYGFDAADNLTTNKGSTQAFNAADEICWTVSGTSGNACASAPTGATTFSYNARGDRTTVSPPSGSATNLGYDQANRLTSYGQGSTTTATYAYNGDGLRMSKTVSGVTTPFTWDVSGGLPLLLSDGTSSYVYGPGGMPLEQITARPAISMVGTPVSTSGKATSLTLTLPSGVQPNDQVFVISTQPSTTTVTAPSGYSSVATVTSGGSSPLAKTTVFRHAVVTGDSSVTLTYSSKQTAQAAALAVYRGIDPSQPVDVYGTAGSTAATTTITAPSLSPSYPGEELLVFQGATGSFSGSNWTAPSGMIERVQNNATNNVSTGIADQTLAAPGATGTRISTLSKSANLTTVGIVVPPLPTVLYIHRDQLGSTRLLTDSAGTARGTFTYDPYGNLTSSSGSYSTPFGFAGEYKDAETGFVYLRARYYDPVTAQFLTRDPAVTLTRSPYAYVAGNPLNGSDPTGLCWGPSFICDAASAVVSTVVDHPVASIVAAAGVVAVGTACVLGGCEVAAVVAVGEVGAYSARTAVIAGGAALGLFVGCAVFCNPHDPGILTDPGSPQQPDFPSQLPGAGFPGGPGLGPPFATPTPRPTATPCPAPRPSPTYGPAVPTPTP